MRWSFRKISRLDFQYFGVTSCTRTSIKNINEILTRHVLDNGTENVTTNPMMATRYKGSLREFLDDTGETGIRDTRTFVVRTITKGHFIANTTANDGRCKSNFENHER